MITRWSRNAVYPLFAETCEEMYLLPGLIQSEGWASLIAQLVNNLPAMQDTPVQFLGWEDLLNQGKGYPLQYSGLENSMDCSPRGPKESDTTERLSLF